jgi:hypothetical protein
MTEMTIIESTLTKIVGKGKKKTGIEATVPQGTYAKMPKGKYVYPRQLIRK